MHGVDWTSEQLAKAFAPGREVLILLPGRESYRRRASRQAVVLGLHQGDLALSQPEPPLPEPLLGLPLEITILVPVGNRHQRYAYRSPVLDVLDNYPPGPQGRAVVVMFPRRDDIYPTSLRKARRYQVAPVSSARLLGPGGEPLSLLDISVKGLRYLRDGQGEGPVVGDHVQFTLEIHDEGFAVHGRVASINNMADQREISVELGILPLDAWASLQELIAELEPLDKE